MISRVIAACRTFLTARGAPPPLASLGGAAHAALPSGASLEPQALFR
jgi:hypothetical protein